MINNYFLLYHSVEYAQSEETLLLNTNAESFDEIAAFFLSLSQERLEYFSEFDAFKKLSKKIITNGFLEASTLFEFCSLILQRLENDLKLVQKYLEVFEHLSKVELITTQENTSLQAIFESLLIQKNVQVQEDDNFLDFKEFINTSMREVRTHLESQTLQSDLDALSEYLHKKTFSIGITGVMNVGKSTFINALLGEELLGSSVVAETANLSILKYSKELYAKVVFFNKVEFDELIHTIEHTLNENLDISKYIQEKSFVLEVRKEELQRYTSAKDPVSEIVKHVELGVDLEFLKDSIEIVDTPGLDDTLIVRETITKTYVQKCDLLIHLMNVNQSATQKDVDFLVDSANNQNLSSILILLTKTDNISKEELDQVLTYTKKTILSQVNTQIPIDFLSISASTKVGISRVNEYLQDTLFDSNTKNISLFNNVKLKLKSIINQQIKAYEYMLLLYSKDEVSLDRELREFNDAQEKNKRNIEAMKRKIQEEHKTYLVYAEELDVSLEDEMDALKNKLHTRVMDEIVYSAKNKTKVKPRQILMLIDKSISHGYIDIIREYKHKLQKYMLSVSKKIEISFNEYKIHFEAMSDENSLSELFQTNASSSLNTSIKMIFKRIDPLVSEIKSSKIEKFRVEFLEIINEEFVYVSKNINATKNDLNEQTSLEFFNSLREPIDKLALEMKEQEELIGSQIYALQNPDEDMVLKKVEVQNKINALNISLGVLR